MTARPVLPDHRPRSRAVLGLLAAATVLLLQVGLSAWSGAPLGLALLVVAAGVVAVELQLRSPDHEGTAARAQPRG